MKLEPFKNHSFTIKYKSAIERILCDSYNILPVNAVFDIIQERYNISKSTLRKRMASGVIPKPFIRLKHTKYFTLLQVTDIFKTIDIVYRIPKQPAKLATKKEDKHASINL